MYTSEMYLKMSVKLLLKIIIQHVQKLVDFTVPQLYQDMCFDDQCSV